MSDIDQSALQSRRQFAEWAREHDYDAKFSNWFIWWRGREPLMRKIDQQAAELEAWRTRFPGYRYKDGDIAIQEVEQS